MPRTRAAACAVGLLLLSGCTTSGDPAADPAATTSASPSSSAPTMPSSTDEGAIEATPLPSTAPAGARTPLDLTIAAMTAFIDHTVTPEVWYERLAGYLSQAGQQAYYGTDPAEVPAKALTGQPSLLTAETTSYLVTTVMPTDVGPYTLLMSRAPDGSWQVERITPPETPQPTA